MMKDSLCQDSDSIDETYESAAFLLRDTFAFSNALVCT